MYAIGRRNLVVRCRECVPLAHSISLGALQLWRAPSADSDLAFLFLPFFFEALFSVTFSLPSDFPSGSTGSLVNCLVPDSSGTLITICGGESSSGGSALQSKGVFDATEGGIERASLGP